MMQVGGERSARSNLLRELLEQYYVRYYRDTLGLPDWDAKVAGRLREEEVEAMRIQSVADIVGRPLRGMRVLNLGCGTGGFNVAADGAGAESWGIDTSVDAIRICTLRRELGSGGRYMTAAAEALPFRDGTFDLVYCLSTLEHVMEVEAAVREMVRVLGSGGVLMLYAPNSWALYESHYKIFWPPLALTPRAVLGLYLRLRGRPSGFARSLNRLSVTKCVDLLRRAGASIVEPFGLATVDGVGAGLGARALRLYYRALRIEPAIQLVARKGTTRP
ncbi:MAG TPA: class I SAM-dependent methyltransferase [Methylomirabilota bacterium]|nr:class I SAM-dependent methyltransferase [Methylomirabilota bacterium]